VNRELPAPHAGAHQHIVVHLLAVECEGAHGLGDGLDALGLDRVARGLAAEEHRRDEEPQLVDLLRVEERAGELRAALEQDRGDALLTEPVERGGDSGAGVRARGDDDLGAGGGERLGVRPRRGPGHDDGERRVGRGLDELRRERQAGGGVEDDAARLAAHALDPRRELRVVGERRADAHGDGVALGPPVVRQAAGARAGDPLRVPGRGGDLPVERHGGLEEDPGPPRAGVLAEGLVQRAGAVGEVPVGDLDLDPLVTQDPQAATRGLRARVVGGDDHAPDPGGDDRLRARRGLARVGAGLERHVHRRPGRGLLTRGADGLHLGVRAAVGAVPALAEKAAVGRADDGADERVRRDAAAPLLRELDRPGEMPAIHVAVPAHDLSLGR
jgi:hypothetical protein